MPASRPSSAGSSTARSSQQRRSGSRRIIEVWPGRYSPATGPVQGANGTGEEAAAIDDRGDLVIEHGVDRLAAVQRFQRGEALRLLLDARRRSSAGSRSVRRGWCCDQLGKALSAASTAASIWASEASEQLQHRLARLRVQDRAPPSPYPASKRDPISIAVSIERSPFMRFACRLRRPGRRRA